MDILMEALMNMDDESLDYVLESCDAEELEIISDAMEARFEDGPTVVKDKGAMKTDYINRREASKKTTPSSYDLEAKLVKNLRGHDTAQTLGVFNRMVDKDKDSFSPQQAQNVKEIRKKKCVSALKNLNKSDGGRTEHPLNELNKVHAKLEYPNNKAKQTERLRQLTKKTNNASATFLRKADR